MSTIFRACAKLDEQLAGFLREQACAMARDGVPQWQINLISRQQRLAVTRLRRDARAWFIAKLVEANAVRDADEGAPI